MPLASAVDPDSGLPPLGAAYHWINVPVAVKFATVGLLPEQKVCDALPLGADGVVFTVAVTSNRVVLSQPDTVSEA